MALPESEVALYQACDSNVADAERALLRAQAERRKILLRLHDDGHTYTDLMRLTGRGHTSVWKELERARADAA